MRAREWVLIFDALWVMKMYRITQYRVQLQAFPVVWKSSLVRMRKKHILRILTICY